MTSHASSCTEVIVTTSGTATSGALPIGAASDRAAACSNQQGARSLPAIFCDCKGFAWAQNAKECAICGAALGKRRLNPRHHCRLCGVSVCGRCSRGSVELEGWPRGPQRACTRCMASALRAPALRSRLAALGRRLHGLAGEEALDSTRLRLPSLEGGYSPSPDAALEEVLSASEAACAALEAAQASKAPVIAAVAIAASSDENDEISRRAAVLSLEAAPRGCVGGVGSNGGAAIRLWRRVFWLGASNLRPSGLTCRGNLGWQLRLQRRSTIS